jgi:hypothetical protein
MEMSMGLNSCQKAAQRTNRVNVRDCAKIAEQKRALLQKVYVWRSVLDTHGGGTTPCRRMAHRLLGIIGWSISVGLGGRAQCQDACHRQTASVTDAKLPSGHPQIGGRFRCSTGKLDLRRRARRTVNHYISERDTCTEPSAERFEHSLFGCEASCQTLDPINGIADFVKFDLNETTWDQRVTRIVDPALHFDNIDNVDPVSDHIHAFQRPPNCAVAILQPFQQPLRVSQ